MYSPGCKSNHQRFVRMCELTNEREWMTSFPFSAAPKIGYIQFLIIISPITCYFCIFFQQLCFAIESFHDMRDLWRTILRQVWGICRQYLDAIGINYISGLYSCYISSINRQPFLTIWGDYIDKTDIQINIYSYIHRHTKLSESVLLGHETTHLLQIIRLAKKCKENACGMTCLWWIIQ